MGPRTDHYRADRSVIPSDSGGEVHDWIGYESRPGSLRDGILVHGHCRGHLPAAVVDSRE